MLTTQSCLVAVGSFGSKILYCFAITAFLLYGGASAWTQEDLELFDVVEDVNENFYTFLGLSPDVDTAGIKKAYRKLSLQFHPDKNKEEGSEEKFRKIVAVVEILKDEEKRKKYDAVLENGLPDWRQPVYYYRRVRKMGIAELSFFLVVLLTLGQHVLAWAAYWERKFELEETVLAKFKRKERKSKKLTAVEDEIRASYLDSLGKPSYQDLLIVRFIVFLGWAVWNSPTLVRECFEKIQERRSRATLEEEKTSDEESCDEASERERKPRRRARVIPEAGEFPVAAGPAAPSLDTSTTLPKDVNSDRGGVRKTPWGEEDTVALIRAMKKYPTGTVDRWQKIADLLNRSQDEVMSVMKQLRNSPVANAVPHSQGVTGEDYQSLDENATQAEGELSLPPPTRAEKQPRVAVPTAQRVAEWSQEQQKCMEAALQMFPKGTEDRWDRIAEAVPGKSKEECMLRFKFLVEQLKRRKVEEKSKMS
uniref:DnaJ-like protein subfamily C member 1 n=1 Tax=Rhipicephalus zambeziensis TaxID=60191 RepID=A0A224YLJ1_9ACAR